MRSATSDDIEAFFVQGQPLCQLYGQMSTHQRIELLLRPLSRSGEALDPLSFVEATSAAGYAIELDIWVARQATTLVSQLIRKGSNASIAINVSAATIEEAPDSFFDRLSYPVCLEIPETMTWPTDTDKLLAFCHKARSLGHWISLDDFSEARAFPDRWLALRDYIHELKIDLGPNTWARAALEADSNFQNPNLLKIIDITNDAINRKKTVVLERGDHQIAAKFKSAYDLTKSSSLVYARQDYNIAIPKPLSSFISG